MKKIPKLNSPRTPENIRKRISSRIILAILVMFVAVGCTGGSADQAGTEVPTSVKPDPKPKPTEPDTPAEPKPTEPDTPVEPGPEPTEPDTPAEPKPTEPDTPVEPGPEPTEPDTPAEPKPTEPDTPVEPGPEPTEPDPIPTPDPRPPQIPPCPDPVQASVTTDNSGRQVVSIPDANFEAAVKSRMGKSENNPIYLHEMAALTRLLISGHNIRSLEGLQYAENLTNLGVGYNSICDLSPLSDLTELEQLWINSNPINLDLQISALEDLPLKNLHLQGLYTEDLSIIAGFTGLEALYLGFSELPDLSPLGNLVNLKTLYITLAGVSDISALSSLAELIFLSLESNQISDLSALSNLQDLSNLSLRYNNVTDISPLVSNSGLGSGDQIDLRDNPLDSFSTGSYIPQLLARGANVLFDEVLITVDDEPQIYKNNVFVMPVDMDIARGLPPYESLTTVFYERFEDVFDFLIIVLNLRVGEFQPGYLGSSLGVSNDVQGIGKNIHTDSRFGSGGKLKSIVNLVEYNGMREGPLLHELIHHWGNDIIRPFGHWGYTSSNGQLGGFSRENFEDLGNDRYAAGHFPPFGYANQSVPYSPIELYLAGFIPANAVPDLLVAEDASLVIEEGGVAKTQEGYPVFTASSITNLTIEDIIAQHGERIPGLSDSQKDFRAAVIFVIDEDNPATREGLDTVSRHASWFSNPANDNDDFFNFYEATGGRATIRMDRLSEVEK